MQRVRTNFKIEQLWFSAAPQGYHHSTKRAERHANSQKEKRKYPRVEERTHNEVKEGWAERQDYECMYKKYFFQARCGYVCTATAWTI